MTAPAHAPLTDFPTLGRVVRNQRWRSGLPLGGIGCGRVELLTDGALGNFTGNHNWDRPTGVLRGGFFALELDGRTTLLRLRRPGEYDDVDNVTAVESNFLFPRGHVRYGELPIELELEAFAPLIPQDIHNSSLPVALFTFHLRSATARTVRLLMSWENLLGCGGRKHEQIDRRGYNRHTPATVGDWSGLLFTTEPIKSLNVFGEHLILSDGPAEHVPHWDSAAGMIARTVTLTPAAPAAVHFLLTWYMPHHVVEFAKRRKVTDRLRTVDARQALTDDVQDVWQTDAPTLPGEALVLDLPAARPLDRIVLNNHWWQGDFTAGFALEAAGDDGRWQPVAHQRERVRGGIAEFTFAPHTARRWRITQTGWGPDWKWCVRHVRGYHAGEAVPFVAATGHIHDHEFVTTREDLGHYHTNWSTGAVSIAEHVIARRAHLLTETRHWHDLVLAAELPEWFKTLLLNHSFPAFSNTLLTRDGRFSVMESLVHMDGALGTMDQRQAAHAFWTMLFPELDRRELELYAACQDRVEPVADGRIPHFCGNFHHAVGEPMVDYGSPDWPDLSCSWIMQVLKWYRWTGDRPFLLRQWPHVQRALAWLAAADTDGDGIPEGGSTYDYEHLPRGAYIFTASVYLGALRAASALARAVGAADPYAERFARVQQSTLALLYDRDQGTFIKWRGGDQVVPNTFVAALAGDWFVRLIGLEPIFPPDVAESALRALLARHLKPFSPIPPMEVTPDGQPFTKLCFVLQHQPYLGCEAIYQGYVADGLEVHRRVYEAAWEVNWSPWDCSLNLEAPHGKQSWLLSYMTTTATWHALPALAGLTIDLPARTLHFRPTTGYRGPLFFPTFWLWLDSAPGKATARVLKVFAAGAFDRLNDWPARFELRVGAEWDLSEFAVIPADKTVAPHFPPVPPPRPQQPWTLTSCNAVQHDAPPAETGWAIDGDPRTCWWTNEAMRPGDWLAVDFGQPRPLRGVRCDHRGAPGEYPRGLRVEVCDDGRAWQPAAELGESAVRAALVDSVLTVPFAATARHLRLVQLGRTSEARWSIYDLSVL
jgi:uncharacterized protein (DUF608 family)